MTTTQLENVGETPCDKKPGRPRCPEAHQKILDAALVEVQENGYHALSMEAIAGRAQVSKATVYRRWGSKAELMLDAMQHGSCEAFLSTGTGSLRADLENQMASLIAFFNGPQGGTARAVIAAVQSDVELAEKFRESWTEKRRLAFDQVFADAQERGELAADADCELLIDLVWGPIYYRFISSFELIEGCLVGRVLDKVMPSFVR